MLHLQRQQNLCMIDIGYTGAEYLKEEMESRGMASEIIWGPSASDIQNNLKNGKVMLVSVNSSTIFTSQSHIMTIVDINSDGQIYICNPSSSTNEGWFDVSEVLKGCDYIVVTNANASGVADADNNSSDSNESIANTSSYVAVVATWNQTTTSLATNDPDVAGYGNRNIYSMTTTTVNYQEMVDKYTMPFDFLWALLVTGEEKEFVFDLADLVYNSDIQVTIYDNLTVNTDIDEWKYDEQCKTQADIAIVGSSGEYSATRSTTNHEHEDIVGQYSTTKTVITQTNTINQVLTKANTWIVDYSNDYTYESTVSGGGSGNSIGHADQEYPASPTSTGTSFSCELTEQYKQEIINEITQKASAKNTSSSSAASAGDDFDPATISFFETYAVKYYNRYINISEVVTNTTETKKYTEGTPTLKEKTDASTDKDGNPKEVNFVTIYKKKSNTEARRKINSITSWLFEIIENNGKPDLDLVKYLLYKATGDDYGILSYDFGEYDTSKFTSVVDISGSNFEEKIWFALLDAGYSKYAAAGALGNFYCESGVIACRVQGDYSANYATSQQYTASVDSGAISRNDFIHHGPRRRRIWIRTMDMVFKKRRAI